MAGRALQLPPSILAQVFQSLHDRELKAASKVCRQWAASLALPEYWSLRADRDGMGALRPRSGISPKAFYMGFDLVQEGAAEWLLWYDPVGKRWEKNEELAQMLGTCGGSAGAGETAVVSVVPATDARGDAEATSSLLSALMRSSTRGFPCSDTSDRRIGIQIWNNPCRFPNGTWAIFARGSFWAGESEGEQQEEHLRHAVEAAQGMLLSLSSLVFVVDACNKGERWWEHVFPAGGAPEGLCTAGVRTARGGRLYVASGSDLCVPCHVTVPAGDRERVGRWASFFEELCFVKTDFTAESWASDLAEDTLQAGSEKGWGKGAPPYRPGTVWRTLAAAPAGVGEVASIAIAMTDAINESHARLSSLFTSSFDDKVTQLLLEARLGQAVEFYQHAMQIEMEAAVAPEHQEPLPPNLLPPLCSQRLIETHEQHLFSACRRLVFSLSDSGIEVSTAFKLFERLKNRISDEFRALFCENHARSKALCETVFDRVFKAIVEKYVRLPDAATEAASTKSSISSGSAEERLAKTRKERQQMTRLLVKQQIEEAKRSFPTATSSSSSSSSSPPTTFSPASPPRDRQKDGVRELKKLYRTFLDRLDEYELKAEGTRRADVMLCKSKDLLEKLEVSAGQDAAFQPEDLQQAISHLHSEVTQRVVRETQEMEKARSGMQKTCALYTKLLGMQCKQIVAAAARDRWLRDSAGALHAHSVRVRLYAAVAGEEAVQEGWEQGEAEKMERLVRCLSAAEAEAAEEISKFTSGLPMAEKLRYHRFGVVSKAGSEAEANGLRNLNDRAKVLFSKLKKKIVK